MKLTAAFLVWLFISSTCFAGGQLPVDSTYDFTSNLSPAELDLSLQKTSALFQKKRLFIFGITNQYCYILLKVQGNNLADYLLSIDNTSMDAVLIYKLSPTEDKILLYQGGNAIPYGMEKAYVWHTIPLEATPSFVYYLVAIKTLSQNVNVTYEILTPQELQRSYRTLDRLIYFYLGFILLISLISLIGNYVFKRKTLVIYTGYVLSVSAWILAHYGYLFAMFFPSLPVLNGISKQVSSLLAMFFLLTLITGSFKTELAKNHILKALRFLKCATVFLIVLFLIHLVLNFDYKALTVINFLWHASVLFSIGVVMAALVSLYKFNRTARIFSIAISLVTLMAVLQMVSNMGWAYNYFLNEHGMLVASLLEMLVLTFGIFYNLWEEKKQQEEELKTAEVERSKTLQMLITVQDEERKRIASDLHDSIGPMLAAIKINFMRLQKAKAEEMDSGELVMKTENIIDESIAEIRNISHQLMPKGLSSKGLITLLSEYFNNLETVHQIHIYFTHEISVALDKEVQLNLYRMICELSLNAAKHSEAQTLSISIKTLEDETIVFMKDDGKGFSDKQNNVSSLGIKNVRSRVDYFKGTIKLESIPGKGTSVQISIPHKQDS